MRFNRFGLGGKIKVWRWTLLTLVVCTFLMGSLLAAPSTPVPPTSNAELVSLVRSVVNPLDLSRPPTTTEIMAAGQLGGELHPTREFISKQEQEAVNRSFGEAIQAWNRHDYQAATALFEEHLAQHPESPWASEARLHCACYSLYHGRYSDAEASLAQIIEENSALDHPGAKSLLAKARLRLGNLRVAQGEIAASREVYRVLQAESPDWRHRTYASHWIKNLASFGSNQLGMMNCGSKALAGLLERHGKRAEAREVLKSVPDNALGHSFEALAELAARHGYELVALKASVDELATLPCPAIMHVHNERQDGGGHYWLLEKAEGGLLELVDPQSERRFRQQPDEFAREWSGMALIFAESGKTYDGKLTRSEMQQFSGACCGIGRTEGRLGNPDPEDKGCPVQYPGTHPGGNYSYGAPRWKVNMINMNLFVTDTPLWYRSPIGPPVNFTLSYNSQSATAYHEPFGNKWQFNYGSYLVVDPGETVTVFMPDGRRDVFNPDGAGGYLQPYSVLNRLTKIAENHFELLFPDDTIYVYRIPAGTASLQPFLTEIRDAHGLSLTFGYNAQVQLTTITDALGRVTGVAYNAAGLATSVTDPFGRSASFEYDANRNLVRITDMGNYWSTLSYDADVYLTSIGNARGLSGFYIEPADGDVFADSDYPPPGGFMGMNYRITITNPVGGKEEYYFPAASIDGPWYVSPRDFVIYESPSRNNSMSAVKTSYSIGAGSGSNAEILSIVRPGGSYAGFGYDSRGNRTEMGDGYFWAHYTYNDLDRVISSLDANSQTTTFSYAPNGIDVVAVADRLGTVTYTYNTSHDVESITDRMEQTTTFDHNSYGQLTASTDATGKVTTYIYDPNHQLQQIVKDNKILASFSYDSIGRIRSRTDAAGLALTFDYNDLNNITRVTHPDGKFVAFTYAGCCPRLIESVTDRFGRVTRYVYDELDRLRQIIDPESMITAFEYDANGNRKRLIDANSHVTTFDYDLDNRVVTRTSADGKRVFYTYDGGNVICSMTNGRGADIDYGYDGKHNLVYVQSFDDNLYVGYNYDLSSRRIRMYDETGIYVFGYDANSRITSVDGPWDNDTLSYYYDQLGRRTRLERQGGQSVTYQYDALDRLTQIQAGTNAYTYAYVDANPLVQNLTRPGGSVSSYQNDGLNRLTELSNRLASGTVINQYGYEYNERDLRDLEEIINGEPVSSFRNENTTYEYNDVNQMLLATDPNRAMAYDADGNLVRGYTPQGYEFNATYDALNRLKTLEYTDSIGNAYRTEYGYNGFGVLARVKKYLHDQYVHDFILSETRYVLDGYLPVQERDMDNNVVREYTWGPSLGGGIGGLLGLTQGGQHYSYLYNGRGDVTALVDSSQNVVATYTYDPFGNLLSKTGTVDQPFRYSTKLYDEKTGLSYFGYRFYSPALGRWLNRDPLGEAGGINLYSYVRNNPLNRVDPYGMVDWALLLIGIDHVIEGSGIMGVGILAPIGLAEFGPVGVAVGLGATAVLVPVGATIADMGWQDIREAFHEPKHCP
jgi:RHS repeat-associated protein